MKLRNIVILLVALVALSGGFYFFGPPKAAPPPSPQEYVWLINMDDITNVEISLPRENASEKFVKISHGSDFPWFFDDGKNTPVDSNRWSSGIPLLLSGPAASRIVTRDATPADLTAYGLTAPQMKIVLTLTSQETMTINVGDQTPDGQGCYVQAPNSTSVATVDNSWYSTISQIVENPPYVTPTPTPTSTVK